MYSYIVGKVTEIYADKIVVENNNIGYEIYLSNQDISRLEYLQDIKLSLYLDVKEDHMKLFGFINSEDKTLFLKLLDVNGIGVKTSIGIIGALGSAKLTQALIEEDINTISKCPGIGKKTAQRIVLELRGKLVGKTSEVTSNSNVAEAFEGMQGLGFDDAIIKKIFKNIEGIEGLDTSDIIKLALKEVNNA